jgi:hypothetical protein
MRYLSSDGGLDTLDTLIVRLHGDVPRRHTCSSAPSSMFCDSRVAIVFHTGVSFSYKNTLSFKTTTNNNNNNNISSWSRPGGASSSASTSHDATPAYASAISLAASTSLAPPVVALRTSFRAARTRSKVVRDVSFVALLGWSACT